MYFRAILVALVPLYGRILILLAKVSQAQPMPFLTGYHLPMDLTEFIGPSWSSLLTKGFNVAWLSNTLALSNPIIPPTDKNSDDMGVALKRGVWITCSALFRKIVLVFLLSILKHLEVL